MAIFNLGRYVVRRAETSDDVRRAQQLRYLTFIAEREMGEDARTRGDGLDRDAFDERCIHILIEDKKAGQLVCCFRMMPLKDGADVGLSYSAQYYDLSNLESYSEPLLEMGRFCIHPEYKDPNILRLAWREVSRVVDEFGIELLFGCSSFEGVEADDYVDSFALLKERHLAPTRWLPRVKAAQVFRFGHLLKPRRPDLKIAMRRMPPLLRSYLLLGGWVSDHAVIDNDLNTLHVFTGVEIKAVPPKRAQLLRGA